MIKITKLAKDKIQEFNNNNNLYLRVGCQAGGCAGIRYVMDFTDEKGVADTVYTIDGVDVIIDFKSGLFLDGVTLDYSDGLNGQGFTWENPKTKSGCGCGESFSV